MARLSQLPLTFEQCRTLSITELSSMGYLKVNTVTKGILSWTKREEIVARISVTVNRVFNYIEVNYLYGEKPIGYKIQLVASTSNLGQGIFFYFVCPKSGVKCRKLHFFDGYFMHRTLISAFYQWQLYGHKDRALCRLYEQIRGGQEAGYKLAGKNFRKSYKGYPTKRFLKYQEQKKFADIYPRGMLTTLMII